MAFPIRVLHSSLKINWHFLRYVLNNSAGFSKLAINGRPSAAREKFHSSLLRRMSFQSGGDGSKAKRSFVKAGLLFGGATIAGFYINEIFKSNSIHASNASPENVKPSRSIKFRGDNCGLKLILYQYQTCPFCCKVRAFLDYNGISYDVVEVDPVMRQQIKFSKWRKVPILLVKDESEGDFKQLNDSSLIISLLQTYLINKKETIEELTKYYPIIVSKNDKGKEETEILNRYHIMYLKDSPLNDDVIQEEEKWRMWADDTLVHMLSPNVYRTTGEALQAFKWFSEIGKWETNFPLWERLMVIYVGATAMYFIGKRLKKRHKLDDDVRLSLYKACKEWTDALGTQKQYMGGQTPNLSDLAVFGVLNSIEGCTAFKDILENTKIEKWFNRMKTLTNNTSNRMTNSSSA